METLRPPQIKKSKHFYFKKFQIYVLIFFPSISGDARAVDLILSDTHSDPESLNKNFEKPLDLARQAGHYQEIREVYEVLDIFGENSMEGIE